MPHFDPRGDTLPARELVPRAALSSVELAMRVNPVVVLTGARQTGKTALAQLLAGRDGRRALTLDDPDTRERARTDPVGLLSESPTLLLDEVQREPGLILALKRVVDEMGPNRRPGRFLLTGSANLLLMKQVADSLAGRASYVQMHPFTRREMLGMGSCGAWSELFDRPAEEWPGLLAEQSAPPDDWRTLVLQGGFPYPAYWLQEAAERTSWFRGYESTYLERDLRDLSDIHHLPSFRKLIRAVCLRIGNLLNQTELGRDVGLHQSAVHRYLDLLETSFQLHRLRAWSGNRTTRLIKAPKAYWVDTAAALHLSGAIPDGAHLENLILNDLLVWRDSVDDRVDLGYWRTAGGREVDFIIERGRDLLAVEVKATPTPSYRDATAIRDFVADSAAVGGVLLHGGEKTWWIADQVLATPWWKVI
jgi:uncharacterized protein